MLNNVVLQGRLTADPDYRAGGNDGISFVSFTIAVERDVASKDGDRVTDFIDCLAWRQTADFVRKYLSKGRMINVVGKLQSRKWEDKNGNKRSKLEILVSNVYFGDSKKDSKQDDDGYTAPSEPKQYRETEDDGWLPF